MIGTSRRNANVEALGQVSGRRKRCNDVEIGRQRCRPVSRQKRSAPPSVVLRVLVVRCQQFQGNVVRVAKLQDARRTDVLDAAVGDAKAVEKSGCRLEVGE